MELLIAGLRLLVDQNGIKYTKTAIIEIIRAGADGSFRMN